MISIVICTYNRASSLAKTLETLRQITVPPDLAWELIVVDNNSNDNTCGIVEEFARTSGLEVRYIFEPAQGLDRARNVGIMKARGEIVAFVDDDVLVTEDWMANVWREFNSDSDLGLLGGRVELADSRDLPMTIRTSTTRTVVRSFLNAEQFIVGCSWAFRRSVLEGVGEFDPVLDCGTRFCSAGDTDYLYRILMQQRWKVLYAPSVLVFHNHGRRTRKDELALRRAYDTGRGAFFAKHILSGDVFAAKLMYWTMKNRIHQAVLMRNIGWGWWKTRWLMSGFATYLFYCGTRALAARRRNVTAAYKPFA